MRVGEWVRARRNINQVPLCEDPDVPRGTIGSVEDDIEIDSLLAVDFGIPYGVVLCDAFELESA